MFRTTVKLETWRDKYDLLKVANEQFREEAPIMTPLENKRTRESIARNRAAWYREVYEGATGEFFGAVNMVKDAEKRAADAKRAEYARWSSARLAEEMRAAEVQVTGIINMAKIAGLGDDNDPGAQIAEVLNQAAASGDIHRQRGALEIARAACAGLVASGQFSGDNKATLNRVARQATRDLAALRVSPEMEEAETTRRAALDALNAKAAELREIGTVMDNANPDDVFSTSGYSRTLKKVRLDQAGNIEVLANDDPEVTGVIVRGEK